MVIIGHWRADRGGAFTDVGVQHPNGEVVTHKLLSENPGSVATRRFKAVATFLLARESRLRPGPAAIMQSHRRARRTRINAVKLGATVGTNALLERRHFYAALLLE